MTTTKAATVVESRASKSIVTLKVMGDGSAELRLAKPAMATLEAAVVIARALNSIPALSNAVAAVSSLEALIAQCNGKAIRVDDDE